MARRRRQETGLTQRAFTPVPRFGDDGLPRGCRYQQLAASRRGVIAGDPVSMV